MEAAFVVCDVLSMKEVKFWSAAAFLIHVNFCSALCIVLKKWPFHHLCASSDERKSFVKDFLSKPLDRETFGRYSICNKVSFAALNLLLATPSIYALDKQNCVLAPMIPSGINSLL